MEYYTADGVLYHHGVKGQEWGVKNGPPYPLSNKQKKKISKQYSDSATKAMDQLRKEMPHMRREAYDKAEDEITTKVNSGKASYSSQEEMDKEYEKLCNEYFDKSLLDWYHSNELITEGRKLVKEYDMTSWDKLAKTNEASIELMEMFDKNRKKVKS